ncbi:60S ribosomal protein L10a-like [Vulpes lagopus]|uniref:60S ribosomal protein L10a-like n=1 Tax=Vulpes lagopus TaxID=494514 RepID=UPI001BC8D923|nr:60S ribosomal protein L10a-like [Vulpes lagopus]
MTEDPPCAAPTCSSDALPQIQQTKNNVLVTLQVAYREEIPHGERGVQDILQTVLLQISLQNSDSQTDRRFSGIIRLKFTPRLKFSICVLGDQQHCDEAKAVAIPRMNTETLKKLNKNKKLFKKLAKKFDAFLALESLVPQILGPDLNKAGKFPSSKTHVKNIVAKMDDVKFTIKLQTKKVLCLPVAVGHVKMTDDELVYNIHLAVNFLVSLLKKGHHRLPPELILKHNLINPSSTKKNLPNTYAFS